MKYLVVAMYGNDENDFSDTSVLTYTLETYTPEEAVEKVKTELVRLELIKYKELNDSTKGAWGDCIDELNKGGFNYIDYNNNHKNYDVADGWIINKPIPLNDIPKL